MTKKTFSVTKGDYKYKGNVYIYSDRMNIKIFDEYDSDFVIGDYDSKEGESLQDFTKRIRNEIKNDDDF